jgi:hypothetical protein
MGFAKVTINSSITRMSGFPQETQYYTLSFIDQRLDEFNISAAHDSSTTKYAYISDKHIQSVETMTKTQAKTIQDFHFDTHGNLIKLIRHGENNRLTTTTYHYDDKGFLLKKRSSESFNNINYETDAKGNILKEIYADNSGYNLFIYEKGELYAINFYNENSKYMGGMIFKKPISFKTLMLLE